MLNRWARDKAFKTVGWSFPQISPLSKQNGCTSNSSLSGICVWFFMPIIPATWKVSPYFNYMFKVHNKTKQNKTKHWLSLSADSVRIPGSKIPQYSIGENQENTVSPAPLEILGNQWESIAEMDKVVRCYSSPLSKNLNFQIESFLCIF